MEKFVEEVKGLLGISWGWWIALIETVALIVLAVMLYGILQRAKNLGLPVGRKKEGVLAILWGKVAKLRFTPLKGSNVVELEVGDKTASWVVDDLPTKPVSGLYGITATVIHADTAQAIDPELATLFENTDDDMEAVLKEYFKAMRDLDELKIYLAEAERAGDKKRIVKLQEAVQNYENYLSTLERRLRLSPVIERVVEGGRTIVLQDKAGYVILRPVDVEKLKRYARALPAPSLYTAVMQYVNELKGKQTDVLKVAFAILLVLVGVGVLLALRQQPINYEQLARIIHQSTQSVPNMTKVVVS